MPKRTDLSTSYHGFVTGQIFLYCLSSSPEDRAKSRFSLSSTHAYITSLDVPAPHSVLTHVMFQHALQRRDMHLHLIHLGFLPAQRDAFCQIPGLTSPNPQEERLMTINKSLLGKPNEMEQRRWQSHRDINSCSLRAGLKTSLAFTTGFVEKDGFQHVKTLTEYRNKWHAVCGYMIFWFTKRFCKLSQPFHGRSMKIIMDIHILLGIFKSLDLQRQAHGLYKYCQLACLAFKFHEP